MKVTETSLGKMVETDVLVLGAGVSGSGAAIAAKREGADVVLLDKGRPESCGQARSHREMVGPYRMFSGGPARKNNGG